MPDMQARELQVFIARPGDYGRTLAVDLDWLLDDRERERAARFRHEADRRAYVLAHALRRWVLAQWLAIDPCEIVIAHERGGRPQLVAPRDDHLYFSHSRSRDAVACAVTRIAPVGIDVETMKAGGADEQMIERFVVLEGDAPRNDVAGDERAARFYFYWTALEAFWKAEGKGLADGNPRIECRANTRGQFEIWLEGDAGAPKARLFRIQAPDDACITLALCDDAQVSPQLFNGKIQLGNALSAHEMLSPR